MGRRITILLLAALCAASFSGCTKSAPEPTLPEAVSVLDFRLGEGTMTEPPGEVSFPLDGLLGVPKGENCPVVFILHGAHAPEDVTQSRYYQGFSYLVEALAEEGYLAISLNSNRAFSFEPFEGSEYARAYGIFNAYYDLLTRANDGEMLFSADLTGKIDLSRLNFIGHSRGGDDSLYITKQLQAAGSKAVQSVILVASPLMITQEDGYADVATGIILSQYDGDVTGLETATLFNRAWFVDRHRQTPVTMAFLYGGNHNQYNTEIPQTDSLAPPQNVTYLEGEVQRNFLKTYALKFLEIFNQNGEVTDLGSEAPTQLGFDFMPSVILPGGLPLENFPLEAKIFSQIPGENTIAPFNHPGPIEIDLPLYRISWTTPGILVTAPVTQGDWAGFETLTLLLANDPTSISNESREALTLSVTLTDGSGASASATLDAETAPALRYLQTPVENLFAGMENMPTYFMAQYYTPLSTALLPLSDFSGVDLGDIRAMTIHGLSETGAIVLGGGRLN